ncbi:MAG: epoxyqueuosine reductase QueH [Desulfuromonadaceae bacterium]|nr:epoxyqueuosine reductase QueH [Desulfuromonadaceae bacterium]MDD5105257.1 epoxyqueuosine reductase QueH [Desulfuromonadaceae bacterium]
MNILLHTCCGPCALFPLKQLRADGHEVTGFFYNHNIHPYQEYVTRRDTLVQMADLEEMPLLMRDDYDLEDFLAHVAAEPKKRCSYCYASRLRAAAEAAADGNFDAFTASLLYSRYQKHDEIRALGEAIGVECGVPFFYQDFRSGWQEGIRRSKDLGLYRQQYCGCIYSEKERYLPKRLKVEG